MWGQTTINPKETAIVAEIAILVVTAETATAVAMVAETAATAAAETPAAAMEGNDNQVGKGRDG